MLKHLSRLRLFALVGGLILASACSAGAGADPSAPYTEGSEYVTLPAPAQRYSAAGKVEVVEVFSYGCVHCAHFAPTAEKLRAALPKGVEFKLVPAPFSAEWLPYARAFYAAKKLGVVERTHLELFREKFEQNYPLNTLDELADFYARQGVNRDEFMRIATSDEVTAQMKSDLALIQKWGVTGTPTIVVNGKYRSGEVHNFEQLSAMTQWLAKRELGAK
ncbi:thiol:disulfide interchange protein DsbA/DsbL [Dyella sp.]|jgi:thiol:disulfide interchange protein DsbA|uniref:thiol:disulfide interchange protein DsbA/DsbL n=1 Tax=Dyella sp. TaxID=1869338 RepID=UPI002D786577|nr:thiol:disulfide interchange protein DsbA/DsbL [Dyella sp.]HET6431920.1 thiol:disulfide interchange protein DsbA/DsbL [Dyella sp.]